MPANRPYPRLRPSPRSGPPSRVRSRRPWLAVAALACWPLAAQATTPKPPFDAWLGGQGAYVREGPVDSSRALGLLRHGDRVRVQGCVPSCEAPKALAQLAPAGYVRLAQLRTGKRPAESLWRSADGRYRYGQVVVAKATVREQPNKAAKVIGREKRGFRLAFAPETRDGWLRRIHGGWVQEGEVKLLTASTFAGRHAPEPWLAFVVTRTTLLGPSGERGRTLARYETLQVRAVRGRRVLVEGGSVARSHVRLAVRQPRPASVPVGARWVHVDLAEQVLTAYEGDRHVFSTLVSTGKADTPTKAGLFLVLAKTAHSSMRGRPPHEYFAEEVPSVMHFYQGQAIHGTYWHDGFGAVRSKACVNMSVKDADWLLRWAPPVLPDGWHTVLARDLRRTGLYVHIERRGASTPAPVKAVAATSALQVDGSCVSATGAVEAARLPAHCRFDLQGHRPPSPPAKSVK